MARSVLVDAAKPQLGMSYASASRKLVRHILFDLLREYGRNICFRCNKEIGEIGDFSIEHKTPWLNGDPLLFWDLTNIAFSHRKCNSGARRSKNRWSSPREAGRESFKRWYVKPGNREKWNAMKRADYARKKNMAASSNG